MTNRTVAKFIPFVINLFLVIIEVSKFVIARRAQFSVGLELAYLAELIV